MFANTVSNKWTETTALVIPTVELLVFALGEVTFGIPMSKIGRVINNLTPADFQLNADLELLDLHRQLFGTSITATAMVIFNSNRSYCIPVDTTPNLTCIPLDRIRTLPVDFGTNHPLGLASHLAIAPIDNLEVTIFILGGDIQL
jgi:hypothetical protein